MSDDLRRALERVDVPDEHDARVRAWEIVRAGFAEREPVPPRRRRLWRPALAVAIAAAVVAGALSSPGRALIDSVREAIGVEEAAPSLFDLPAGGRMLVTSGRGVWVVRPDGSKRLLGRYREASWSPFGRYVVAARANELVALEPGGGLRWSLARRAVQTPRWGGTRTDTRIAYLSGRTLHVVAGDGTGDRALLSAPDLARSPLAWRPGRAHALAYATGGTLRVVDTDRSDVIWSARVARPQVLAWSTDGSRLLALSSRTLTVFDATGHRVEARRLPAGATGVAAAFEPGTYRVAVALRNAAGRSEVRIGAHRVFSGPGTFPAIEWSPDGRWLLVAWKEADQWVFLRSTGSRSVEAVSSISRQFRGASFPRVEGWCCAVAP